MTMLFGGDAVTLCATPNDLGLDIKDESVSSGNHAG